jgi:glycyl-tRNA synthetase
MAVFKTLQRFWHCEYDESGAIGKRYRRQDELGTPFCITIDFDTLENDTVTLRDRDSMQQERVPVAKLLEILGEKLA